VAASGSVLPYGYSDWLLAVGEEKLKGLVWADKGGCKAVMPLFAQKKWGIVPYVSMPGLTQRLGLYARDSTEIPTLAEEARILLRRHFLRVDLSIEQRMVAEGLSSKVQNLSNLVLPLNRPLEEIELGFGKSIRQKLKAAEKAGLDLAPFSPSEAFAFIARHLRSQGKGWGPRQEAASEGLVHADSPFIQLTATSAQLEGETLAAAIWVVTQNRIIYLASASTQAGFAHGAMAWLIWQQIKSHSGKPNLILDFEGGAMGGTGQFFSMFGAQPEPYWQVRLGM
jgi:hypothetical protein